MMGRFRDAIVGAVILLALVLIIASLFAMALYAAAIIAPVLGLFYLAIRATHAYGLWRSHGRFMLPDDSVRVIGTGRARWLAVFELLNGFGGLVLTFVVPALVFGWHGAVIPEVGAGLILVMGSNAGRRRVEAGTHPIDILPPE